MVKLSKIRRIIGFSYLGVWTLFFLLVLDGVSESLKNLVSLIFGVLAFLNIIIIFFTMLKEREYQVCIEDIEYIKENISKVQWQEYKNKLKNLNTNEKCIYTEELLKKLEEKESFEREKFKNEVKQELDKIRD